VAINTTSNQLSSPSSPVLRETCWPDEQEQLLLHAGLQEPARAVHFWQKFCSGVTDIEALDGGAYRLFPLVAVNLKNIAADVPHKLRLHSVLRHSWVDSQRLFARVQPVLQQLREKKSDFLILKGMALSPLFYRHWGARPMADIDLLVRPEEVERAAAIIEEAGYLAQGGPGDEGLANLIEYRHELSFRNEHGVEIDLHWHLIAECRNQQAEKRFWQDAVSCPLPGLIVKTLCPTDHFFHTCIHGVQWNEVSPVRWLADSAVILREQLDWQRLAEQAHNFRRIEPVRQTLLYLEKMGISIPPEALDYWRNLPISDLERLENNYRMHRPNSRQRTRQLALAYLRLNQSSQTASLWRNMFSYMRQIHHFRAMSRRMRFIIYVMLFNWRERKGIQ